MSISEIKSLLSIDQIIAYYGLELDQASRMRCPFHADKTPSFQVYRKTNTCYCFSSNCPTHGSSIDVIDFIMYKEGLSKHEALLKATALAGGQKVEKTTRDTDKTLILTKLYESFKKGLQYAKNARAYLESRGLDTTEVGYNSGQFHHGKRRDEALIKKYLQYGVLLDRGVKSRTGEAAYQAFGKWSLVFALRSQNNEITGLYFRSILNDSKQRHFYLKNRSGLYPHYPKSDTQKLILTESIIDAATLLEQDKIKEQYSVLALYGTNGFTAEHQVAIHNLGKLEELIFFLNGDEAGRSATKKYAHQLHKKYPNLLISEVKVLAKEDVNSLIQSHEASILEELLNTRQSLNFLSTEKVSTEKKVSENKTALDTSNTDHLRYSGSAAHYHIRGFKLQKNELDSLKISVQIEDKNTHQDHRARLDLYDYKQIKSVVNIAADRLGLRSDLLEKDLSELTKALEDYRLNHKKENKQKQTVHIPKDKTLACISFLKQDDLLTRLNELIGAVGISGEQDNRLLLFIIATSYKMPDTLHALIQGSSGSGKTSLMRTISELMPQEHTKRYTRVTDNSFYNQEEYFFVNKLVCFEDLDGLKEEAQLAVRELQSNKVLISSTSVKDKSGSISGGERIVRGPIASLSCTTNGEIYEDNISRCFVVAVDESRAQTLRIIEYQNQVAAGKIDKEEQKSQIAFIQNCVRLLKVYDVINPYAAKIRLPENAHKIRRLNELYQSFVRQITLLHQYQRKQDEKGRLISEKADLELACDILFESILLKVDELDGSLRQFYEKLKTYVQSKGQDYEFNRFEVRQVTGVSKTQQHYYMQRLVELEYIKQYGYANRGYRYKISHWDNMSMIRAQIKNHLYDQLSELK